MKYLKTFFLTSSFLFGGAVAALAQDHYPEYMKMANRAYSNEKYDLAAEYYESAAEDQPDHWQAYQGLGSSYYMMKRPKDALKAFEKALKLNPQSAILAKYVKALQALVNAPPTPTPAGKAAAQPATSPPLPR